MFNILLEFVGLFALLCGLLVVGIKIGKSLKQKEQ